MFDDGDILDFTQGGSNVFPFLSMLFCTLGAMILIWLAASLFASTDTSVIEKRIEHGAERKEDLLAQLEALQAKQSQIDEYQISIKEAAMRGKAVRDEIQIKENEYSRLESELGGTSGLVSTLQTQRRGRLQIRRRLEEFRGEGLSVAADIVRLENEIRDAEEWADKSDDVNAELEDLAEQQAELRRQWREVLENGVDMDVAFELDAADPKPELIYVDLTEDGVVVHDSGPGDGRPAGVEAQPGRVIDTAVVEEDQIEQIAMDLARRGSNRYALVLVRPGKLDRFRQVVYALRKWRVPFIYEPADAAWKVKEVSANTGP